MSGLAGGWVISCNLHLVGLQIDESAWPTKDKLRASTMGYPLPRMHHIKP